MPRMPRAAGHIGKGEIVVAPEGGVARRAAQSKASAGGGKPAPGIEKQTKVGDRCGRRSRPY